MGRWAGPHAYPPRTWDAFTFRAPCPHLPFRGLLCRGADCSGRRLLRTMGAEARPTVYAVRELEPCPTQSGRSEHVGFTYCSTLHGMAAPLPTLVSGRPLVGLGPLGSASMVPIWGASPQPPGDLC